MHTQRKLSRGNAVRSGAWIEPLEAALRASDRAIAERVRKGVKPKDIEELLKDSECLERVVGIMRRRGSIDQAHRSEEALL